MCRYALSILGLAACELKDPEPVDFLGMVEPGHVAEFSTPVKASQRNRHVGEVDHLPECIR